MATKRELIDDPNSCLNRAADDEQLFLLRSQDMFGGLLVFVWCKLVEFFGDDANSPKLQEARRCARAMLRWSSKKVPD